MHHSIPVEEALSRIGVDPATGLSSSEAVARLAAHGPNEIRSAGARSPWALLAGQFSSTVVLILIAAAAVSGFLGEYVECFAIAALVILNGALGFLQEFRAERALEELRRLSGPSAQVRRDGRVRSVPASEVVPGDIVQLEAGQLVPADGRLIETANLRVQESALTGESEPVAKDARSVLDAGATLPDRVNMVHIGTVVAYGRGTAAITATGSDTELGRVAGLLEQTESESTPLEQRLDQLGRHLAIVALALVAILFAIGWWRGEPVRLLFLTAISVAVAAVPEGLPAAVTVALALGAQRMLARHALVRRLAAVETLGSVSVICSDKTGTLTQNRMRVVAVVTPDRRFDLPAGPDPASSLLLLAAAACNDAEQTAGGEWTGDPTETAFKVAAAAAIQDFDRALRLLPRIDEVPFSSESRRMTTIHKRLGWPHAAAELPGGAELPIAFVKGAVDVLLAETSHVWTHGRADRATAAGIEQIRREHDELARRGMRVIGVAARLIPETGASREDFGGNLTWLGMAGLIDPPRQEAAAAIAECRLAGIRPVMITGDHPITAAAIAAEVGIASREVITGRDLEALPPDRLPAVAEVASVYARVSPEHKLRIVEALRRSGRVVAMTGDGVNDAPALKRSSIGVAMGQGGTDVAREAADMVLLDNNFATIVAAVKEGRVIYANLRKFVEFLLTCNTGELWVMLAGPVFGMPLPLLPLQILWMNFITDGPPALALGVDPAEPGVMRHPPRPPGESILGDRLGWRALTNGALLGLTTIVPAWLWWRWGWESWQTLLFTSLTLCQQSLAFALRSERDSVAKLGLFTNPWLAAAVAVSVVLQFAVVYVPPLATIFGAAPLTAREAALCLALSVLSFAGVEFRKRLRF
ncbi:MAG: cation-translocating P-type ATPase [Bryobacteraceae bacterium]